MAGNRRPSAFPHAVAVDATKRCRCGLKMHYGRFAGGGRWHVCAHCDKPDCGCPEHRQ